MLSIHNSLGGGRASLDPIEPGHVRMYVCGVTTYDYCHLGHARVMVVFDVVARYLRSLGYRVTYVRNITDIDDKIIRRADETGESWTELTRRFTRAMHEDAAALRVLPPDEEPRATAHIDEIIAMIRRLEERGYAYRGENGDVYYDVSRFRDYGRLSGERPEALRAGARVEVEAAKTDPLDFVLWKAAKPGEPAWESPWGPGRPGWHIECSAMSTHCLGAHFDIHGGGLDLKFPHHENEIAQSVAATGEPFADIWMHNGFVQVDQEKMSKSLGNFFTIRDILARYRPETVRYFIVASHYRSPLSYSDANLEDARASLARLYLALRDLPPGRTPGPDEQTPWRERFRAAMDDDFNTPRALAVLFELAREINRRRQQGDTDNAGVLGRILVSLAEPLGLLQDDPEAFLQGGAGDEEADSGEIEALVRRRAEARARRDWAEADRIRDQLAARGIELEDGPGGTTWRRG
ncbi:MAG TPA: cysteine--tRNA ligase [Gammaproteobacteria bacterium]|nr:cysteine--tRNA ligase [Gammaproteobacteria bacterium]